MTVNENIKMDTTNVEQVKENKATLTQVADPQLIEVLAVIALRLDEIGTILAHMNY